MLTIPTPRKNFIGGCKYFQNTIRVFIKTYYDLIWVLTHNNGDISWFGNYITSNESIEVMFNFYFQLQKNMRNISIKNVSNIRNWESGKTRNVGNNSENCSEKVKEGNCLKVKTEDEWNDLYIARRHRLHNAFNNHTLRVKFWWYTPAKKWWILSKTICRFKHFMSIILMKRQMVQQNFQCSESRVYLLIKILKISYGNMKISER